MITGYFSAVVQVLPQRIGSEERQVREPVLVRIFSFWQPHVLTVVRFCQIAFESLYDPALCRK